MTATPHLRRSTPVPLDACALAHAVHQLPDKWTWLILRQLMFDVGRFADIQTELAIPKSVLSARLAQMADNGLITKTPYRDGSARTRQAYVLTRKGRKLIPVLLALLQWGETFTPAPAGRVTLTDAHSGDPLRVALSIEGTQVPQRRLRLGSGE
ncbi:MAG: winged helix-turn-helix transcriptional regulator [Pseudomonadota bacterium]